MLKDFETGVITGIVAYDLDRLWRQPRDLERVIDLYEDRPRPFATSQGDYDLSTTDGRTMARVMVAFANKSSADAARRLKRKLQASAEEGKPHWSRRPYGWNMDGSLYPPEAAVLSQMVQWFLSGYSYREVTFKLNETGMVRRNGELWYNTQIRKLLGNHRLAAIRVHDGQEYPGTWEPLLSPDDWEAVQNTIKARRLSMRGVPNNRRYLLTGLLVCSKCGNYLSGMTKRDGWVKGVPRGDRPLRTTYQCATASEQRRRKTNSCGGICVGAQPLEHFIKSLVLFRLDTEDLAMLLARTEQDTRMPELVGERAKLTARRDALLDDYADETLSKVDYKRAVARVDAQISAIDASIDSMRRVSFDPALKAGETVREAWDSRPDGWRRELIEVLIEKITIRPSSMKPFYDMDGKRTRFDINRVDIEWRV